MPSGRRQFLQRLTMGSLAVGALPRSLAAAESAGESQRNEIAELEVLRHEAQQPASPSFDVTWADKLTAKYRAVFDVPVTAGGAGVMRAGLWTNHYRDVLKAQPSDMNAVIVIRHEAIPFIMNHEFWERYDIAKGVKERHPMTGKKTKRNIVLMTAEEDGLPPMFAALSLHKQMEHGAIVLACNMAFGQLVGMVAKKENLKGAEARTKALSYMVPGVILQPNGIFGVTLAQQHGAAFVQAT